MEQATIPWHTLSSEQALARLDGRSAGLTDAEAGRRLKEVGRNELPTSAAAGIVGTLLRQITSPLIYVLLAAGVLSLIIGDRWDAVFIFGVLIVNACVSIFQELRADASSRALRSLVPQVARIRRGGISREVPAPEIVPGDIAELESGMRVTADMRLLEAHGLQIDEAPLTGESFPVLKHASATLDIEKQVGDRINMAFAGTSVVGGRALAVVAETGERTQLGHIGRTLDEASRSSLQTPLVRRMNVLARQIALGAVALIAILAVILLAQGGDWREVVLLSVALAVAAIPEGLPIAVTVTLAAASRRMARRNVIVRALPAVEGLGACTMIATDKTGTLTVNRLTVETVAAADGERFARSSWLEGEPGPGVAALGLAAALCNEARLMESGSPVGDAVDVALLDLARESGIDLQACVAAQRLSVIPYEPELRFAAVEAEHAGQVRIIVKGAPETVLPMCDEDIAGLAALAELMAAEGYRVIMLAEGNGGASQIHIRDRLRHLNPLGLVGLTDPLRFGAREAVSHCQEAGIEVRMITGDHPATALTIARKLGMLADGSSVMTGSEMTSIASDEIELTRRIIAASVYARIEPQQKLQIVRQLSAAGHIVAVTGDGVNDGPALRAADIGVAMGMHGTDVARESADLILADDNFSTIVVGVEEGRITFSNIRKVVMFTLATGFAEIGMFLLALATGLPMPLTPVQLLWLNLVTNGVQDVTLGFGRGEGDELQRPPRRKLASLIDRKALVLMVPGALAMTVIAVWLLDQQLASGASIDEARNAVLLMVVLYQNAFLIGLRHLRSPFWRWKSNENPYLFGGLTAAVLLQFGAMYWEIGQQMLGLGLVSGQLLLTCLAAALFIVIITEFAKWFARRLESSGQLRSEPHVIAS